MRLRKEEGHMKIKGERVRLGLEPQTDSKASTGTRKAVQTQLETSCWSTPLCKCFMVTTQTQGPWWPVRWLGFPHGFALFLPKTWVIRGKQVSSWLRLSYKFHSGPENQ